MNTLVVVLAFIVAGEYLVIAVVVVPKLAHVTRTGRRVVVFAQWGAIAFFLGCAVTHTMIGLQTLDPGVLGGMDMAMHGGTQALLWEMIVPHIAQVVGGATFIWIAVSRLDVSITSKTQANELRVLNRQLRAAFERAPLGFSLMIRQNEDDTAHAVYVNPAFFQIFGLDPHGPLPTREDLLDRVHPDDRAESAAGGNELSAGRVVEHDFRVVHPDGRVRWVRSRLSPAGKEGAETSRLTVVVEDINDRVTSHAALEQSERRFTQLGNSVGVGISLRQLDPPKLLWVNAAYAAIVGDDGLPEPEGDLPAEDASRYDDPGHVLVHPDDRERVLRQYWSRAQAGEVVESEHRVLRPDGLIRWVHAMSSPVLDDDGGVTRVAGTIEDITVRKNAEEAVRVAQASTALANSAKAEFLSRVSHELRTPLNAVLGFGQLLEADDLLPEQHDAVAHILRGGRHLLSLVNDVLDISNTEADELDLGLEPVAVCQLLGDVIELMRPVATATGITLCSDHQADPEIARVMASPRQLKQVLLNLLSNAIKYNTVDGNVHLSIDAATAGRVRISVKDTGVGIRTADLSRLLVPFDRLGQENTSVEGAGIALALTDRLVNGMGGELEVESTFGLGSTFSVSLPTAPAL